MNKAKFTALCHRVSEDTGLPFNSVMVYYFLESILKRITESKYKSNFIFKGGFLLSNLVGIQSRSTVDMDFLLNNEKLSEDNIINILKEVLANHGSDNIIYKIMGTESIKDTDKYGGVRCKILCKLENIRVQVPLDIATGDIITPSSIDYQYVSCFDDRVITIKAYPIETMIAEKIETIFSKGLLNSRSKDFYDLYIIYNLKSDSVDGEVLKKACINTFSYRNTEFDTGKIINFMEELKTDKVFLSRWKAYINKNIFAKDLEFEDALNNGIKIVRLMDN
ncbi:nucleotidyl transferase AbiEii/AbiGii toxin family protein [uncultured Anaerococcus sp.]|uniref:nucleotidyl transferase AbiEii/AbiGii toxin family protein n=1 Tax=uncultured Anaerococcus sp. TaxID=293428 RepID=UPI0028890CCE|nr:nucleotidyl transferase AbiEii/AbiGii toxin family protein [uncultured Anaerococcus sp.]